MKNLVVLTVFLGAIAVSMASTLDTMKERVQSYKSHCINESGVTLEELNEAIKTKEFGNSKTPDFLECFFKKAGVMKRDGTMNFAVEKMLLTTVAGEEKANEVFDECHKDEPKSGRDAAVHLAGCLHKHALHTMVGFK